MRPRALITGILGFCGSHLWAQLQGQGYAVFGFDLPPSSRTSPRSSGTLMSADAPAGPTTFGDAIVYRGDIRDVSSVQHVIESVRPTHVFHLAGLIAPNAELDLLFDVNVRGTEQLLTAIRLASLDPVIIIPGSSAAYGRVPAEDLPIRESQPFRPLNRYAVSKIAQEMLAYAHHVQHGLRVIRTRAFNVTGPGEPPSLACSAFARQIAQIEAGQRAPVLQTGNLSPRRDYVDVRDLARAYLLVANHGVPGAVYNICSGQAVSIQECLDQLLALASVPIQVAQDKARVRLADLPVSVGDPGLLREATGWQAEIPLKQSLADLLEGWRKQSGE